MRALVVCLLVVFAAPIHAAENDEDKAKEVAAAFLKALIAKDTDALMKTVDAPFVIDFGVSKEGPIKSDELKEKMTKLLEKAEPDKVRSLAVGKVYDMAALGRYAKEKNIPQLAEQAEKLVGKDGCMVMLLGYKEREIPGVLIRFKDGKAFIASLPK
jgi:hypothetical protein